MVYTNRNLPWAAPSPLHGQPPNHKYYARSKRFAENPIPLEYEEGIPKKVHKAKGAFRFNGERFQLGTAFNGNYIAIKKTDKSDEFSVFFIVKRVTHAPFQPLLIALSYTYSRGLSPSKAPY